MNTRIRHHGRTWDVESWSVTITDNEPMAFVVRVRPATGGDWETNHVDAAYCVDVINHATGQLTEVGLHKLALETVEAYNDK